MIGSSSCAETVAVQTPPPDDPMEVEEAADDGADLGSMDDDLEGELARILDEEEQQLHSSKLFPRTRDGANEKP